MHKALKFRKLGYYVFDFQIPKGSPVTGGSGYGVTLTDGSASITSSHGPTLTSLKNNYSETPSTHAIIVTDEANKQIFGFLRAEVVDDILVFEHPVHGQQKWFWQDPAFDDTDTLSVAIYAL